MFYFLRGSRECLINEFFWLSSAETASAQAEAAYASVPYEIGSSQTLE